MDGYFFAAGGDKSFFPLTIFNLLLASDIIETLMNVQPVKRKRLEGKEVISHASDVSDINSVELSSDPFQKEYNDKTHYKSRDRSKWITILETSKSIDEDAAEKEWSPPESSTLRDHELLNDLLHLVHSKLGQATALRKVVRELRTEIT